MMTSRDTYNARISRKVDAILGAAPATMTRAERERLLAVMMAAKSQTRRNASHYLAIWAKVHGCRIDPVPVKMCEECAKPRRSCRHTTREHKRRWRQQRRAG